MDKANYMEVYAAPLTAGTTLEDIYRTFNVDHPADFKGHSLSVSDVVVLHQNGQDTAHYCDSVGFQQVPEFLRETRCAPNLSDGPCRRSQGRGKGTESQEVPRRKTEKAVHPGTAGRREKGAEQAIAATGKDKGIGGVNRAKIRKHGCDRRTGSHYAPEHCVLSERFCL